MLFPLLFASLLCSRTAACQAQGANQALSDAVLLADTLAASVLRHGPHAGLDAALPLFEEQMQRRAARAVAASREKAKELHRQAN